MALSKKKIAAFVAPDLRGMKLLAADRVEEGLVATFLENESTTCPYDRVKTMFIPHGAFISTADAVAGIPQLLMGVTLFESELMPFQHAFHKALASNDLAHFRKLALDVMDAFGEKTDHVIDALAVQTGFVCITETRKPVSFKLLECSSPTHSAEGKWTVRALTNHLDSSLGNWAESESLSEAEARKAMYVTAARRCLEDSADFMHTASYQFSESVLHWALRENDSTLAIGLIEKSPAIDRLEISKSYTGTALNWACLIDSPAEVVRTLLQHGASMMGSKKLLCTPIEIAQKHQSINAIAAMLEESSPQQLKDLWSEQCLPLFIAQGFADGEQLIRSHIARLEAMKAVDECLRKLPKKNAD